MFGVEIDVCQVPEADIPSIVSTNAWNSTPNAW